MWGWVVVSVIAGTCLAVHCLQTWVMEGERQDLYVVARRVADQSEKPLLVVGAPQARGQGFPSYPHGDVTIDIDPRPEDLKTLKVDVEVADSFFVPGQFGAAFMSHVLEHVERPQRALDALMVIADRVFVAYPQSESFWAYCVSDHRWIIDGISPEGRVQCHRNPLYVGG